MVTQMHLTPTAKLSVVLLSVSHTVFDCCTLRQRRTIKIPVDSGHKILVATLQPR